ncbi:hypothetical protein GCM10010211_06400 [Streptomyces albospinus]|uniref:UPF0102 protein GCM10010211_06400 n=1 Tax=Streptomyces albospinus TaxID=285515 RepID=A0ABQ2UMV3_9ACTN|nr:hypothetical protein GCM10010211_06400 [Streptomyces albospinus]
MNATQTGRKAGDAARTLDSGPTADGAGTRDGAKTVEGTGTGDGSGAVPGVRTRQRPGTGKPTGTRENARARSGARSRAARAPDRPTSRPRTRRRALGRYGEDLAARRLTEAGMRILDRNWRCRDGEIDIVAADGDALVICEVKTRRAGSYEHPMAAVRPAKAARLRLLAERWLERHGGPPPGGVRIDVIGILLPARGAPAVEHVRGVA